MSAVPHPIARARAFCPTCDGLGMVGDDDPLRFPTLCDRCDGSGLIPREACPKCDGTGLEYVRAIRCSIVCTACYPPMPGEVREADPVNLDPVDDLVIAAIFAGGMILLAIGIGVWGLWYSGFLPRVLGL